MGKHSLSYEGRHRLGNFLRPYRPTKRRSGTHLSKHSSYRGFGRLFGGFGDKD